MICHCFYFSDGFKNQPYVCNNCHVCSMTTQKLSDFFVVTIEFMLVVLIKKQQCLF